MKTPAVLAAAILVFAAAPAFGGGTHKGGHYSFGEPGNPAEVSRTVNVTLNDDMKILHDLEQVKLGETIRFVVTNQGAGEHEFSLGDAASQRAHAAMMKKMPDMKHENDPAAVTLAPGATAELVWTFSKPVQGMLEFSCQIPGHYEAGMTTKVALVK
jgi:uncharacterized cupredoxin-like copper-binding protein